MNVIEPHLKMMMAGLKQSMRFFMIASQVTQLAWNRFFGIVIIDLLIAIADILTADRLEDCFMSIIIDLDIGWEREREKEKKNTEELFGT